MWFWWFLFVCDLIVPIVMIGAGRMMWKHCPDKINRVYGYRTKYSMINDDTWKFAHDYCGRLWLKIGWIMLILSILVQIPFYHGNEDTIGAVCMVLCYSQLIGLVLSIIPTEIALRKTFDKDGIRK